MISFGAQLRKAREEKGWTVDFVSFKSKIRPGIIEHLETDRYSIFTSASYARSFLRKYAEFLGLDLEEQIDQFEVPGLESSKGFASCEGVGETLETAHFSRKSRRFRKANHGAGSPVFLFGSVVALISAFAGFYYLGSRANVPEAGARGIMEEFDNQQDAFSREKDATEHLISQKVPVQKVETSEAEPRPFASTNYQERSQGLDPIVPGADFDKIAKPVLELPEPLAEEKPGLGSNPAVPKELNLNPLLE